MSTLLFNFSRTSNKGSQAKVLYVVIFQQIKFKMLLWLTVRSY